MISPGTNIEVASRKSEFFATLQKFHEISDLQIAGKTGKTVIFQGSLTVRMSFANREGPQSRIERGDVPWTPEQCAQHDRLALWINELPGGDEAIMNSPLGKRRYPNGLQAALDEQAEIDRQWEESRGRKTVQEQGPTQRLRQAFI